MADVHRICAACGKDTPLEARHCPHCGHDTISGLPVKAESHLPAVMGKAALPVLATAGTLVARVMWKLLRDRLMAVANAPATPPATRAAQTPAPRESQPVQAATRRGRSIRIRTSWAVGDANGMYRQGYTDQQIDFDD
ncbi:MAG: hypothetical protein ACRC1H_17540 [Caldilineaceae bacterium]